MQGACRGEVFARQQIRSTDAAMTVEEATEESTRRWRWLSRMMRLAAAAAEREHNAAAMAKEMFGGWVGATADGGDAKRQWFEVTIVLLSGGSTAKWIYLATSNDSEGLLFGFN